MASRVPSEKEVLGYFDSLCNWGRWGDDDQLGTLNFLNTQKVKQAVALVDEGATVSCARTVSFDPAPDIASPALHFMVRSGEGFTAGGEGRAQAAADFFGMVFHGGSVTHVDSLAHFFWQGKMYNGRSASLVTTAEGATVESIELAQNGIVTRGVLVDAPYVRGVDWLERGEGVTPADIEAAEERCGFKIEEGDALLVRTGQLHRRNVEGPVSTQRAGSTACQAGCLPLFHQRGIALIGSDTPNDVSPSGYSSMSNPIHQVGIVAMGLWIMDNANLEELAEACRQRNRWEFMLSIAPLRLHNTTGSPVNPIATF